jgi:hypothetical protein
MPTDPETSLRNDLLWGAQAIADFIGRDLRQVFHALQQGHIPAKKSGRIWISSKASLRAHYSVGAGTRDTSEAA